MHTTAVTVGAADFRCGRRRAAHPAAMRACGRPRVSTQRSRARVEPRVPAVARVRAARFVVKADPRTEWPMMIPQGSVARRVPPRRPATRHAPPGRRDRAAVGSAAVAPAPPAAQRNVGGDPRSQQWPNPCRALSRRRGPDALVSEVHAAGTRERGRRRVSDSGSARRGACRCSPGVPPPGGRDARGGSGEDGGRRPLGDVRGAATAGGERGQSPRGGWDSHLAEAGTVTSLERGLGDSPFSARASSIPSSSRRRVRSGCPVRACRPGRPRTASVSGRAATSASDT